MNRIKGLALGLGVVALMVVGLACGAGKTPAGSDQLDTGDGQMEIAQALEAADGSELTVSGFLISDSDGNTRLCTGLLESFPPQCGGDRIDLLGFDASSVPNSKTPQRPSEIRTARWTDSYITVTGIKGIGGLAEVQLSTDAPSSGPVSTGSMLPRPQSVEELVARADVVFIGTINSVLDEKMMGPYGEDGQPLPAGDDGLPFTDYEVVIEGLLKGDGQVLPNDALVLRMFGHLSNRSETITPDSFTLPNPGDNFLFALGRNPDGTYGSGPEGLLNISRYGENVSYADGVPFGVGVSRQQFFKDMAVASGAQATQTGQTSEPAGPLDTTWAEVTILSVEDDMATMKIQELMDYFRYERATYPELNVADEILVRVYSIAPLGAVSGAGSVAMAIKVGEAPPEIPQPVLIEGDRYRAEMSACFSDAFGGLSCPFEGWSAAIYPLEQSPRSIAPPEESNTTPPPPTITPLGGARLTEPVPANDEKALRLELFSGQRQDVVGNPGAVVATNEPETFAGLWIEHLGIATGQA